MVTHNLPFMFVQKVHLQGLFLVATRAASLQSGWERLQTIGYPAARGRSVTGMCVLSPVSARTSEWRQVAPAVTFGRRSCLAACAPCLHFSGVPFACSQLGHYSALLEQRCACLNHLRCRVYALWWLNLPSPQGSRWASRSQPNHCYLFAAFCACVWCECASFGSCLSSLL